MALIEEKACAACGGDGEDACDGCDAPQPCRECTDATWADDNPGQCPECVAPKGEDLLLVVTCSDAVAAVPPTVADAFRSWVRYMPAAAPLEWNVVREHDAMKALISRPRHDGNESRIEHLGAYIHEPRPVACWAASDDSHVPDCTRDELRELPTLAELEGRS